MDSDLLIPGAIGGIRTITTPVLSRAFTTAGDELISYGIADINHIHWPELSAGGGRRKESEGRKLASGIQLPARRIQF